MKFNKKMLLVSLLVGLASQISIGLMINDFRVSAGIIAFVILLLYYEDLKPVQTGLLSGLMVYLFRLAIYYLTRGNLKNVVISYQLEILFYIFYSLIYSLLIDRGDRDNINFIFLITTFSDFGANIIEMFTRARFTLSNFPFDLISTLLLIALVRSSIIWIALNLLKYYRMFLMKEEHERRYKKLLWLISELKTEMYWMEKNMDNIEKVMSNSYNLFEKIQNNKDRESWASQAISIARDIHEIKKENELIVRGIGQITENQFKDRGMNFKDIISILSETMKREINRLDKDIELIFHIQDNFYTSKHYHLMSILRNLVMNSIDALSDSDGGKIEIIHRTDNDHHILIVSDNGIGIDEEDLKYIFSPGFSTKIDYSTGEINRGLGLSVVKYMVEEQLEGNLKVNSTKGRGTIFYMYIPRKSLEVS